MFCVYKLTINIMIKNKQEKMKKFKYIEVIKGSDSGRKC